MIGTDFANTINSLLVISFIILLTYFVIDTTYCIFNTFMSYFVDRVYKKVKEDIKDEEEISQKDNPLTERLSPLNKEHVSSKKNLSNKE